jgi:hypothetical protein
LVGIYFFKQRLENSTIVPRLLFFGQIPYIRL